MVTAVILAAGQAKRMGRPKQLLPLAGKPMIWQVAAMACQAGLAEVIVITGAYASAVGAAVEELPVRIIYNEDWAQGQSTSVKKAVQSVAAETRAVIFLLADQPLVDVGLIHRLVARYDEINATIIMPRYHNKPGNPVLFELAVWHAALLQLSGDEGARQIIRKNPGAVDYLELVTAEAFQDVDTPIQYEKMVAKWERVKKTE